MMSVFLSAAKPAPTAVFREKENFRQAQTSFTHTHARKHIHFRTLGGLAGVWRRRQRCLRVLLPPLSTSTSAPQRHSCSPARGQTQVSIRRRVVKITPAFPPLLPPPPHLLSPSSNSWTTSPWVPHHLRLRSCYYWQKGGRREVREWEINHEGSQLCGYHRQNHLHCTTLMHSHTFYSYGFYLCFPYFELKSWHCGYGKCRAYCRETESSPWGQSLLMTLCI